MVAKPSVAIIIEIRCLEGNMYLLNSKPCSHPRKGPGEPLTSVQGQSGSVTGSIAGPASPEGHGKAASYSSVSFTRSSYSQSNKTAIILYNIESIDSELRGVFPSVLVFYPTW